MTRVTNISVLHHMRITAQILCMNSCNYSWLSNWACGSTEMWLNPPNTTALSRRTVRYLRGQVSNVWCHIYGDLCGLVHWPMVSLRTEGGHEIFAQNWKPQDLIRSLSHPRFKNLATSNFFLNYSNSNISDLLSEILFKLVITGCDWWYDPSWGENMQEGYPQPGLVTICGSVSYLLDL